jgi:hypothetical protein
MYYHLSAIVNGAIKDVLVSEEEFKDYESDPANFFVGDVTDVQNLGGVHLKLEQSGHVLPELFG